MSKAVEIKVNLDDSDLRKRIKRILRPVLAVGPGHQKCELCGEQTSWTINNKFVCPRCSVKYEFLTKAYLYDPCEACGKQGEWLSGGSRQHSLCYLHRDAWFHWRGREGKLAGFQPGDEAFEVMWQRVFAIFVKEMQEEAAR